MGKDKRAKARYEPTPRKEARANEALAREYRKLRPVWKFSRHAKAGLFAWTGLAEQDLPRVFDALASYEGLNWEEIEDPRKRPHCHPMEIEVCHGGIGEYLAQQGWDVDSLFQLSVGNKGRIFGVRSAHVFEIMFWDADHLVYATEKKNT